VESNSSSEGKTSLRNRLQQVLGTLRESGRPDLGDLVGKGPQFVANPWADGCRTDGLLQVRYFDTALMQLGCPGQRGRAAQLDRLTKALKAHTGAIIPPDLRPLWLALESLEYQPRRTVWERARRKLGEIYEKQALAGRDQSQQGYPRLAQLALIAGGLERLSAGQSAPP